METSNHCNFTCGICPNRDMQRKRRFMPDETWEAILNLYIVPYRHINSQTPPTAIFHKDSETLLDRKLPWRLRSLPPDMTIDIYSNGVLLPALAKRGEDFVELLASLPNRCRLMLSYHPNNHDWSNNDYGPMVAYLKEVLRNRKPSNVEFITVSHKSTWVTEEVQESWRQVWDGYPITVHKNCSINPWTGRMQDIATCKYNGCPYGDFSHWFFGCTGNVIACCMDLEEEIVLGNVLTHSPADMFTRTADFYAEQRRARAARERPLYAVCDNCYGYNRSERLQVGWAR